ncbi:MAG: 1-deoxy-D-xylulose-5-phosphate synthase [candidate division Zixibacteria bacterium]|nr:1-deoxy-D-xylulose-5-phosphate synthase [candidate division Zixibacteria bacterium]
MSHLSKIKGPDDLKSLSVEQLVELAEEIRQQIISTVSQTGGHLASNLGAVELTIALHYVYDSPRDKFIWDVSHQTYAHKLLTGRGDRFASLRQYNGLSGYASRTESEHDHYGAGHASTSISAALGFVMAREQAGLDHKVVAIIGDGAMTGGLSFEGMNNAGITKKDMLVVLNENTWSISKNVGAISRYLTNIMADEKFNKLRDEIWELTGRFKRRDKIRATIARIENSIKGLLVPGMLFEKLGFRYFGPIDGHDLPLLVKTLGHVKNLKGPIMLHIGTVKGKGYDPAEDNAFEYHGVGKFDKVTGQAAAKAGRPAYTKVFGDTMVELGAKDNRVIAITAAMASGTGLVDFSQKYPDRFFDVGIAEAHGGCFASGLAAQGMKPYLTVYSTFMQRAYDQVIHDMGIQNLPVVICMDRAGLVGDDGPTHHGVFDLAYLSTVPNFTVAAPKDGNELRAMLHYTAERTMTGPVALRYPRDNVPTDMVEDIEAIDWGRWQALNAPGDIVLLAVGAMVHKSLEARDLLAKKHVHVAVVNARFVKPLDTNFLDGIKDQARYVLTVEEGQLRGGFGQAVAEYLLSSEYKGKFKALGIPDRFVTHGSRGLLLRDVGLDAEGIAGAVHNLVSGGHKNGSLLTKLRLRRNGHIKRRDSAESVDTVITGRK